MVRRFAAVVAVGLLLGACGGGDKPRPTHDESEIVPAAECPFFREDAAAPLPRVVREEPTPERPVEQVWNETGRHVLCPKGDHKGHNH